MKPPMRSTFAPVAALMLLALQAGCTATLDPLTVADKDFARHRDPAEWAGLRVERRVATDGAATWRLWRIANRAKPRGPLWVVPHDNEHGAFAAALAAVGRWGGVMMAVDSGSDDDAPSARFVLAADGRRLDPNRSFTAAWPNYVRTVLADLRKRRGQPARVIVALHTNSPGFDPDESACPAPPSQPAGSGNISIRLCNAIYSPHPSVNARWPFDDDDSLAIVPYLAGADRLRSWCAPELAAADANVSFERVAAGDGSLSNYAVVRGLPYLNFETRERGSAPAPLAEARDRLLAMIDLAMTRCAPPLPAGTGPVMGAR